VKHNYVTGLGIRLLFSIGYIKIKYATITQYYGGKQPMAKTNYSYEKRGRELEKQKKQAQKRQKKLDKKNGDRKEPDSGDLPEE
jgi:hypothetical protein